MDAAEFARTLAHFTGSETFTRNWLKRSVLMTEGVTWLSQNGAAWLIDVVVSRQITPQVQRQPFQTWRLTVDLGKHSGVVTMTDGNSKRAIAEQEIPFTDFPLREITLYMIEEGEHWKLLLASEY